MSPTPATMTLEQAIHARRSVRGYLDKEVPQATLDAIFTLAQQAPSNCNVQPWRVYVASMKMGDLFAVRDDRFESIGLFQDAYSMVHDGQDLYVLHRRNLTRIRGDTFERVAALAHGVEENIDNAYGLAREPSGAFVFTYAANTNKTLPGWGSALRWTPEKQEEPAFGLRRAYGWGLGPEDEVFFTDNQGEWVASSKL